MRKGDATRLRVLDEAARQAATRGITVISLGEVAAGAGISKSGLFKHFESKEAMQQAVLERALQQFTDQVWLPAATLPQGRERLARIFDLWLAWACEQNAGRGCLIMTAAVELDDQPGPLRDLLQSQLRRWEKTLVREFMALKDPPLPEQDAAIAAFQMKSFVLGHNESRRLLEDAGARALAQASFDALLARAGA